MSIQDFNDPLIIQWNTDDAGNKISVLQTNEQHKVVKNKILLNQIPDLYYKVQINSLFEIKNNQEITSTNQFKVDYTTGQISFHPSKEAQTVTVAQYFGRGIIYYNSERIYTELDNAGNVKETLADIFDKSKVVYKTPIASFADIATTYASPLIGWAVQVEDTGRFYRWDGSAWQYFQILHPTQLAQVLTDMGDKTSLLTTIKTSIVNAINELYNRIMSYQVNIKYPPAGFVAAVGDGIIDDTSAILAVSTYAVNNGLKLKAPKGTYRITGTCIHALKTCEIKGAGRNKTIFLIDDSTATYPAIHLDFPAVGTTDSEGADVGGFSIKSSAEYGSYVGEGIRLTNVVRSSFKNIDCRRLTNSFTYYGNSFWNNFENCEGGLEGGIGWLWDTGNATDNNLNTFINCTFQGFLHGLKCMIPAISMAFLNPEFSGYATNVEGRHSIYFHDVVNITIDNGYTEGVDTYVANQLEFNSTGTANGQVVINSLRFRGNDIKNGIAIKMTGSVNLTMNNGVWNGFDKCIVNESSGNLITINRKSSVINAFLDLTNATGYTYELDGKKFRSYFGAVMGIDMAADTKLILAKRFESADEGANLSLTGAGSYFKLESIKTVVGSAAPTTGTWAVGDTCENTTPTRTKNISHWKCATAGTSGVWRAYGTGYGTTEERPTLTSNDASYSFFDTTLAKMIIWNGSAWLV